MARLPRLNRLWRNWLRSESPRRPVLRWSTTQKAVLLLACFVVAMVSSWPWLDVPNLRPGVPAPVEERAPKDARVVDREARERLRSHLVLSTFVQVIDQQETTQIKKRLERNLGELERVAKSNDADRIGPVNLTPKEQTWLKQRSQGEQKSWDLAIISASDRMLTQGLVNSLVLEQLREATSLQLNNLGEPESPARSLGSKLLTYTLQGSSNLRTDPAQTQRQIE
ncbi:MAG: HD family phosphohydrolase, partial [Prochlorococcus sp.]